ncbi:MAG: GMC oxidoreductase [Paracoccaceae bacterium]
MAPVNFRNGYAGGSALGETIFGDAMKIDFFDELPPEATVDADLVVVGGGACGTTIAREMAGAGLRVLVVESGVMSETAEHAALNSVDMPEMVNQEAVRRARAAYHSVLTPVWNEQQQPFGVRCRGLGGSTLAWAGKSATFSDIDFQRRSWVPDSGWPFSLSSLEPFIERAGEVLNLGPHRYDETFWELAGQTPPEPKIDTADFRDFFWQFARSRLDPLDTMRMGADFASLDAGNIRVLLNATATKIHTDSSGGRFESVDISGLGGSGRTVNVPARACVLAAGAIENARLLLLSSDAQPSGLGNRNDLVGRYLSDHIQAKLGDFGAAEAPDISHRFGFFGIRHGGRSHMYSHGLMLSEERQEAEELLNGAVYFMEHRAPDDPVSAADRLLRRQSKSPLRDITSIARSPGTLLKAAGQKALASDKMPGRIRSLVVESAIRLFPNTAAREYRFRGLSHKLIGAEVQGIVEQVPVHGNRVTLSERRDPLGLRLPLVVWRPGSKEKQTLLRMGEMLVQAFDRAGMPSPSLPDWIADKRPDDGVFIDMGATMGTTRMSASPQTGVVSPDLELHDVKGLFVAGGSVMPTTGHANPTLMIVALSIRLADHLKRRFATG